MLKGSENQKGAGEVGGFKKYVTNWLVLTNTSELIVSNNSEFKKGYKYKENYFKTAIIQKAAELVTSRGSLWEIWK